MLPLLLSYTGRPNARFPFKRNRFPYTFSRKRKPQETQALALASSQSWLPLLRPSIPIGWRLRLLRENFPSLSISSPPLLLEVGL